MGRHKMEAFMVAYKVESNDTQRKAKQSKITSSAVSVLFLLLSCIHYDVWSPWEFSARNADVILISSTTNGFVFMNLDLSCVKAHDTLSWLEFSLLVWSFKFLQCHQTHNKLLELQVFNWFLVFMVPCIM